MEDKELKEKVYHILQFNTSLLHESADFAAKLIAKEMSALIQSERDKAWNEALDKVELKVMEYPTYLYEDSDIDKAVDIVCSLKKPTV